MLCSGNLVMCHSGAMSLECWIFLISPDLIASQFAFEIAHCIPLSPQPVSSHLISSHVVSAQNFSSHPIPSHLLSSLLFSALLTTLLSSSQLMSARLMSSHLFSPLLTSSKLFSALRTSFQLISALLASSWLFSVHSHRDVHSSTKNVTVLTNLTLEQMFERDVLKMNNGGWITWDHGIYI